MQCMLYIISEDLAHQTNTSEENNCTAYTTKQLIAPCSAGISGNSYSVDSKKKSLSKHSWAPVMLLNVWILKHRRDFLFWGSHLHIPFALLVCLNHEFRTRRHFTLFTVYLTPEKWYNSFVVFNVLPQWWLKMAKVVCFCSMSEGIFFLYKTIYYFLVASGNKDVI